MASNKKTKKNNSGSNKETRKKSFSQKSKIKVRVAEEPTPKKSPKPEEKKEDLNLKKKIKDKDEFIPFKSKIFHSQKNGKKEKKEKPVARQDFFSSQKTQDEKVEKNLNSNKKNKEKKEKTADRPSFNLYRKIAFSFIVLTIILLGVVFYFSFHEVSITLYPKEERISDNLILDIYDKDVFQEATSSKKLIGVVEKEEIQKEKDYPTTGTKEKGAEIVGTVEVINDRNAAQTLVATTRLLSPGDKLYRIEERLDIPPGESREVEIYTENPDPDMAIGPTEFTIPGLWAGLQDKVYARSRESFEYKIKTQKYVEKEDIEKAIADIKYSLKEKVKEKFSQEYKEKREVIFNLDENSLNINLDVEAGEEKNSFSVSAKADVELVAFDLKRVEELAEKKLYLILPQDKKLISFNKNNIGYSLDNFDFSKKMATINASFNGVVVTKQDAQVIDKDKIVGLDKEELEAYLGTLDQFSGYKIEFSPSFMKTVPRLKDKDRIKIKIESVKK